MDCFLKHPKLCCDGTDKECLQLKRPMQVYQPMAALPASVIMSGVHSGSQLNSTSTS